MSTFELTSMHYGKKSLSATTKQTNILKAISLVIVNELQKKMHVICVNTSLCMGSDSVVVTC